MRTVLSFLLAIVLVLSVHLSGVAPAFAAPYDPGTGNGTVACSGGGVATIVNFVLTAQGAGTGSDTCVGALVVPATVTGIAQNQAGGTTSKRNAGLTTISFEVGTQIQVLGVNAFIGHTGLTKFTIPSTVTTLGQNVFYNTGLSCVTIPANVRRIGANAFEQAGNIRLVRVFFLGNIPGPVGTSPADPQSNNDPITHDGAFSGIAHHRYDVRQRKCPTLLGTTVAWVAVSGCDLRRRKRL